MAITYYAGNRWTGTASDRSGATTTYLITGLTFLETDTDDLYQWDGDSWNIIAGGSIAQTFTNKTINGGNNTLTAIANGSLTNSSITVSDGSNTSPVALGGTLTFAGTSNEIEVTENAGTITIAMPNNVTIGGNLIVNGTTTTVNSTVTTVDDPVLTLGGDSAPGSDDNKDRGIEFRYYDSAARVGFFGYDDSAGVFTGFTTATNSSEVFSGTVMNATFGNIAGTLTTAAQTNITSVGTLSALAVSGTTTVGGANVVTVSDTQTLTNKTLTAPKIANAGFVADANGNEQIIFNTTGSAVNEIAITNAATGDSPLLAASGETNIGLKISGKGTGGVTLTNSTANGAFLEFDTKATPADPAAEAARLYLKQVDSNNNALAVKIQKGGSIVEVEITSPKAVCAVCGGRDGASDPTYDFSKGVMILDLWCGHSFEVPMQWSHANGNSQICGKQNDGGQQ